MRLSERNNNMVWTELFTKYLHAGLKRQFKIVFSVFRGK